MNNVLRVIHFCCCGSHPAGICLRERTISCAPLQLQLVLYRTGHGSEQVGLVCCLISLDMHNFC